MASKMRFTKMTSRVHKNITNESFAIHFYSHTEWATRILCWTNNFMFRSAAPYRRRHRRKLPSFGRKIFRINFKFAILFSVVQWAHPISASQHWQRVGWTAFWQIWIWKDSRICRKIYIKFLFSSHKLKSTILDSVYIDFELPSGCILRKNREMDFPDGICFWFLFLGNGLLRLPSNSVLRFRLNENEKNMKTSMLHTFRQFPKCNNSQILMVSYSNRIGFFSRFVDSKDSLLRLSAGPIECRNAYPFLFRFHFGRTYFGARVWNEF